MVRESHSSGYLWLRAIACYGAAALIAWQRGWEPSFIVFVVSFYAIPLFIIWRFIEQRIFPRKRFEVAPPPYQTLKI